MTSQEKLLLLALSMVILVGILAFCGWKASIAAACRSIGDSASVEFSGIARIFRKKT